MKRFKYTIFLGFCALFTFAQNEQIIPISLDKVLEIAGADNLKIKELQLKHQLATEKYHLTKDWWMPTVYGGFQIHHLEGAPMNTDGRFFLNTEQDNFWAGAGVGVNLDFAEGAFQTSAAKMKAEAAGFQSQAEKNAAMLGLIVQYFELQAAQAILAANQTMVAQSENIVNQLNAHTEAGLTQKSDLLLAKSNLNHHKITLKQAEIDRTREASKLAGLLNLDETTSLFVSDTVLAPIQIVEEADYAQPIANAFALRPELKTREQLLGAFQKERTSVTGGLLLPQLQLGYSNALFGDFFSPTDREGNETDNVHNLWEFNGALLWRFPLSDLFGGRRKHIFDTKIQIAQNQLEQAKFQIQKEVQEAVAQVREGKEAIELAKESFQFASEALNLSLERQRLRTARPFEVFQTQEVYFRALNDYIKTVKDYNQGQYALWVALGNGF